MRRRKTGALIAVAVALMEDPDGQHWGYETAKRAGVKSGVLYPMLTRMLDDGWLTDGWEDPASITDRRPPRRYYKLTETGKRELGALRKASESEARVNRLEWGIA